MRALHLVSRDTDASPTGKSHQLQEDLIGRQAATDEYPKVVAEGLGNLFSQVRVPKLGQQRCNQSSLPAPNSQQCRRVRGKIVLAEPLLEWGSSWSVAGLGPLHSFDEGLSLR